MFVEEINRVHELTVNVELNMKRRSIANSDRGAVFISTKMGEGHFVESMSSIDAEHEWKMLASTRVGTIIHFGLPLCDSLENEILYVVGN